MYIPSVSTVGIQIPNFTMDDLSQNFLPAIYVHGTSYQVGFNVGRTFKSMIQEFVQESPYLNFDLIPAYKSDRGQKIYHDTVARLRRKFPYYVKELEGIADGSQVPFDRLMLLHMDAMILEDSSAQVASNQSGNGCTTILCNRDDLIIGHTEDAFPSAFNRCYVVHAHIIDTEGSEVVHEEKFSSLCYAGHLPGFCMNVNSHGFVYTINVIEALHVLPDKTPRHFLTRALLSARNLVEAQLILLDSGTGAAHGFCVNMSFLNQEGHRLFHSAEVGPAENNESQLSILTISPGETHAHCNKYLRLKIAENPQGLAVLSSNGRHDILAQREPSALQDVLDLLSDESHADFRLYRRGTAKDEVVTIATGIFDFRRKVWLLYADQSNRNEPVAIFPMEM